MTIHSSRGGYSFITRWRSRGRGWVMNGVRSVGLGRGSAPGAPDPFGLWLGRGSGAPSAEPRIRKRLQTPRGRGGRWKASVGLRPTRGAEAASHVKGRALGDPARGQPGS